MNYDINAATSNVKAIMKLRGIGLSEVCKHTGIQNENLVAWLRGVKEALSEQSYSSLLSFLGISDENKNHVHVWKIPTKNGSISKEYVNYLTFAAKNLLINAQITEINIGKTEFLKKKRVFIMNTDTNLRVILVLQGGIRAPKDLNLATVLPNVEWLVDSKPITIDKTYTSTAKNASLTFSEIDDIMNDEQSPVSWADLRLIAREHGITPTELSQWIMSEIQHDNALVEEPEQKQPVVNHAPVEQKSVVPEMTVSSFEIPPLELEQPITTQTVQQEPVKPRTRVRKPSATA